MATYWKKIVDEAFSPPKGKWLLWTALGPLFLVFSAITILIKTDPFQSVFLLIAFGSSLIFFGAPKKIGLVTLITVLSLFGFYFVSRSEVWLLTLMFALLTLYLSQAEAKELFFKEAQEIEGNTKEAALWKNRFEILKEKIDDDRRLLEEEIESAKEESLALESKIASLKRLSEAVHRESHINEKRCLELVEEIQVLKERDVKTFEDESHQLKQALEELEALKNSGQDEAHIKVLEEENRQLKQALEESKVNLERQEEVFETRRERNKTLLATSSSQSISLKEIAKKIKK